MFDIDFKQDTAKNLEEALSSVNIIRESLHSLSSELTELRQDSFQKRRLIAKKKKELANVHDQIKRSIAEELDGRGKPKFSNEVKRQGEFMMRSAEDSSCRELEDQMDSLMISSAEIDNKIERLTFDHEILLLDYKLGLHLFRVFSGGSSEE